MGFFKNKLVITIIIFSILFLTIIGVNAKSESINNKSSFLHNGVGVVLNSFQGFTYTASKDIKDYLSFLFSFNNVKKENEDLKNRNFQLESKAQDYDSLKAENERLKADLNFKSDNSDYTYLGATIKCISGNDFLDGFIINRGTKDGIAKRMIVITSQGLVGQVTSCESNWSVVQSLSNENIQVAALVESTREVEGIVKGYRDENNKKLAKLSELNEDSAIKTGDVILTSGRGALYPKGIRIGTVIEVDDDKARLTKNAIIQPFVEFDKLEEVLIVIPKDKNSISY